MSKGPYFDSRIDAGKQLADRLSDLRYEDTIVLAVSEGALVVAAQIAAQLHSMLTLLMAKSITLPDGRTSIGIINEIGKFSVNNAITAGQLEDLLVEFHGTIELAKINALHDIHVALGSSVLTDKRYFRGRKVIVVSDGVKHGNLFTSAAKYLHDINIDELILATPICVSDAMDTLHKLTGRIEVLRIVPMYFDTNHYYDDNELPTNAEIREYLDNIVKHWQDFDRLKHS